LLATGSLLGLAGPLAACGQGAPITAPTAPTPAPSHPAVTIEFWSRFGPPTAEVEEKRVTEFNAANAPTKVVKTVMQSDYTAQLNVAFTAGSGPDVYTVGGTGIPNFSAIGAALTVSEYPAVQRDLPDFIAPALESSKYQGKINGLPYTLGARCMIVRKDLMREVGLDPAKFPDTWDEFRDAARRMTKLDGQNLVRAGWAVPQGTSGHDMFMIMHEALGEHPFAVDLSKPTFSGAAGQQALQFLVDLLNKDRVDDANKPKPPAALNVLVAGINAVQWDGPAPITNARQAAPEVVPQLATMPVPKWKQRFTYVGGTYLMVSNKPKDATAAIDFMLYLTAAKFADEINSIQDGVPPRKSAANSPYIQDPLIKPMYEALQYGWSVPNHPYYTQIRDIIAGEVKNAFAQTKSVPAALDDAARAAQDYLNKK
jgi:ABC-type glycerol-3-phosphate transport system substrate-binding protein